MCGIVGAVAARNVQPILLEGLKRLEYRGYDSAGMAVFSKDTGKIESLRCLGKVGALERALNQTQLVGHVGIAHTRWATHGKPSEINAHPHCSNETIVLVHNGIIENYNDLKQQLVQDGYSFSSETDTEVIAHLLHQLTTEKSLLEAVKQLASHLQGAYALAVMDARQTDRIVAIRRGNPLVIGIGIEENYVASDPLALLQVTDRFIFLEENDMAEITVNEVRIYDQTGTLIERPVKRFEFTLEHADKGEFRHFMLKEIHQQPEVIRDTLSGRIGTKQILTHFLGQDSLELFNKVEQIHIVACGTSYHAGLISAYWFEQFAGVPCQVETASEYRARQVAPRANCLYLTISQSGETADTLAALRAAKVSHHYLTTLAICNVATSSLVREADRTLMTYAGIEIGVASTKAFTTQLCALLLLCLLLAKQRNQIDQDTKEQSLVQCLRKLPELVQSALQIENRIEQIVDKFANKQSVLFLGRNTMYPLAMEGALKLKEVSYIHAEAYAGGELKHGPLALIDSNSIVVALAPEDHLMYKMRANLEEVCARGGELIVFTQNSKVNYNPQYRITSIPFNFSIDPLIAPIVYSLPLQLLAYHVGLLKGADIDQPRNLAKSVTVE